MADANRLQVAQRRNYGNNHLFELVLLPVGVLLLALSEEVLQIRSTVHIFAHHGYPVRVVHRLIEVIAKELEDVRVALNFEKLYCLFLYTMVTD